MKEVNRGTVRAISTKTGNFIYGSPCCVQGRGRDSIIVNTGTNDAPVFELEPVFPTTIGMYATTDSLGNPVFEHDIVWIRYLLNPYGFLGSLYRELDHGVVKWLDAFEQLCVCFGSDHGCRMINIGQYAEFEVVGNLFESPVLGRWALNWKMWSAKVNDWRSKTARIRVRRSTRSTQRRSAGCRWRSSTKNGSKRFGTSATTEQHPSASAWFKS